jgi:hypothetical protein
LRIEQLITQNLTGFCSGAQRMTQPIPYGRQHITDEDIAAVTDVLRGPFLTQGPHIAAFETAFANYIGSQYAVAVANGTAALHLCCMALGVTQGRGSLLRLLRFRLRPTVFAIAGAMSILPTLIQLQPYSTLMQCGRYWNSTQGLFFGYYSRRFRGLPC